MRKFLLLLAICSSAFARPVEVHNFALGPLCLSTGTGYYYLPSGLSQIELPDGQVMLSTTQGMITATIAGAEWEGVRLVVSGSEAAPVALVEPYKVPWFFFLAGMAFMLPILAFGLFSRVLRNITHTSGEPI